MISTDPYQAEAEYLVRKGQVSGFDVFEAAFRAYFAYNPRNPFGMSDYLVWAKQPSILLKGIDGKLDSEAPQEIERGPNA